MLTTTHAALTLALAGRRPDRAALALGAVLPDLPAWAFGVRELGREQDLVGVVYGGRRRTVHRAVHSVLGPAALGLYARGRARALAAGWAGHLAVDVLTHRDDAWPVLWPLTDRRWPSPVSYWQREHHAGGLRAAEAFALAVAARRAGPPATRAACLVALGVVAAAAADLVPHG